MKKSYTIDASDKILGRLAVDVAVKLRGKDQPDFLPYKESECKVTVINTDKIKVTGNKPDQKMYYHYSGYPGGLKTKPYKDVFANDSREVLKKAVVGMLPKNKLSAKIIKNLKLYKGEK